MVAVPGLMYVAIDNKTKTFVPVVRVTDCAVVSAVKDVDVVDSVLLIVEFALAGDEPAGAGPDARPGSRTGRCRIAPPGRTGSDAAPPNGRGSGPARGNCRRDPTFRRTHGPAPGGNAGIPEGGTGADPHRYGPAATSHPDRQCRKTGADAADGG